MNETVVNASSGLMNFSTTLSPEGISILVGGVLFLTIFLACYFKFKRFQEFVDVIFDFILSYIQGGIAISILIAIIVGIILVFANKDTYENIVKPLLACCLGLIDAILIASVIGFITTKLGWNAKEFSFFKEEKTEVKHGNKSNKGT